MDGVCTQGLKFSGAYDIPLGQGGRRGLLYMVQTGLLSEKVLSEEKSLSKKKKKLGSCSPAHPFLVSSRSASPYQVAALIETACLSLCVLIW